VPTPFRVSTAGPGGPVLLTLIYDTLTALDMEGKVVPNLAASWQVSADGKVTPVPGTKEALEKYLALQPTGPFADSAKGMLATMDTTVATKYTNPDSKETKKGSRKQ